MTETSPGLVKEGQRRTRKERHPGTYQVSNVTETKQDELYKEDTGSRHLSVGTLPGHFTKGREGSLTAAGTRTDAGTMNAGSPFGNLACEGRNFCV